MTQLGLPYAKGSATSRAAAASMQAHAPVMRQQVHDLLHLSPYGLTGDEIEMATGFAHQTVGPRLLELRKAGYVVDSGARRPTRSGRLAIVWLSR